LRILEEALLSFEGCVMIVSHDRYFLNRVCDGILALEVNKEIYYSEGDYDYYIQKKKERDNTLTQSSIRQIKEDARTKPKTKKLSYKDALELSQIEEKIMVAESKVEEIEKIFSSSDFYEKYAAQTTELNSKLESAKQNVKKLYERWEELEQLRKSIS
jgi:ATP-binding cassette subfamily F protein uup